MNTSAAMNEASARAPNGATPSEMNKLIADIEDVLGKAGHLVDLDVAKLRESLLRKIAAAKSGLSAGGKHIAEAASNAATATDGYVHRSPWQAIGIAAVAGVAAGYLLARR